MAKRINLVVTLMALCTSFLLGLQFYWNYSAYQNSVKTFKSETNTALDKAVDRLTKIRIDEMASQFKTWLADTNLIVITCKYNNKAGQTIFSLSDKYPKDKRLPVSMSFENFDRHLNKIDAAAKTYFIEHFVNGSVYNYFRSGSVYYFTQRLGDMLDDVYRKDRLNLSRLDSLYKNELLKDGITTTYYFKVNNYTFHKLNEVNDPLKGYAFATRSYNYGFKMPLKAINAWFPDPNLVFLHRMKWILLSSLILICITVFCFGFTVKTILKQKKLAEIKNDFVNNMTHELKTPVTTINIAAEAMQDFGLSTASNDEYLGIIRHQAASLAHLVDQILKSVVTENTGRLNLTKTNISALVSQLIAEYKPQLAGANTGINWQPTEMDLFALADVQLFKNAAGNLLDNALKYSGPDATITVSCHAYKDQLILSVADNGAGIPQQYHHKVFDRFFRVPSGNIHNVKGYGLGLSYAKSIIEQHNGTLSLVSKENQGAEFIISIPIIYNETSQRIIA